MTNQLGVWPALGRGMESLVGGDHNGIRDLGASQVHTIVSRMAERQSNFKRPFAEQGRGDDRGKRIANLSGHSKGQVPANISPRHKPPADVRDLREKKIRRTKRGIASNQLSSLIA